MSRSMMNSSRAIVWLDSYRRNPAMTDDRNNLSPVSPSLTSVPISSDTPQTVVALCFFPTLVCDNYSVLFPATTRPRTEDRRRTFVSTVLKVSI